MIFKAWPASYECFKNNYIVVIQSCILSVFFLCVKKKRKESHWQIRNNSERIQGCAFTQKINNQPSSMSRSKQQDLRPVTEDNSRASPLQLFYREPWKVLSPLFRLKPTMVSYLTHSTNTGYFLALGRSSNEVPSDSRMSVITWSPASQGEALTTLQ